LPPDVLFMDEPFSHLAALDDPTALKVTMSLT